MTQYHNFIGIDIAKLSFVVSIHGQQEVKEYSNDSQGIKKFLHDYKAILPDAFCILETTGGYELTLLYTLCSKNIAVHRADTRKVKSFIRSYGNAAKTDALDAKVLAKYGFERREYLNPFTPQSKLALTLFNLVQRRLDLSKMLVAEKNRAQAPGIDVIATSCQQLMTVLKEQIDAITAKIKALVDNDPILKQKHTVLKTVPGIGDIIAWELLILLPELGQLSKKQIASLAGVAPIAKDSGQYQGYRRTAHGRGGLKPILFLAAMAARNSNSPLKAFYENLIARGKKKMVALVALMRKIIVIANARLKEVNFA